MSEIDDFLGGGGPALKFPTVGTTHTLTVTDEPEVTQQTDFDSGEPLTWPDGKPRMQMIIHGEVPEGEREDADDDGVRRLFVKSGLVKALRQAMRDAKVKAPAPGGVLTVSYVKDGPKPARGYPPKVYEASYTPPPPASRASAAEFLGDGGEDEAPAAPKQGRIAQEVAAAKRNVRAKAAVAAAAGDDEEPPF
jgi:hypothetical protein